MTIHENGVLIEYGKVQHPISNNAFFFLETARDQINNGDNGLFSIPLSNTKGNVFNQATGDRVLGVFNVAVVSSIEDVIQ